MATFSKVRNARSRSGGFVEIDSAKSKSETGYQEQSYFPAVETHLIRSKHVPQSFRIQVMQPPRQRGEIRRYPVIYVTDGNAVFDMFKGISWVMQQSEREAPPFVLVAIGYPSDSPVAGGRLRGRDLTFPGCPNYFSGHEELARWEELLAPEAGTADFCGAEHFQRFLGEELIPFIDERYDTVPDDRTYFGHSVGGGFGLYTLFTLSRLFRNYICSSPTVVYNGVTPSGTRYENHDFMLQRAREFIAGGRSLNGVRLYLSVGTEEEFEPLIANWQFVSGFYRMVALLRRAAIPGLTLMAEAAHGETHTTVWPIAFMRGVQAILGTRRVSSGNQ